MKSLDQHCDHYAEINQSLEERKVFVKTLRQKASSRLGFMAGQIEVSDDCGYRQGGCARGSGRVVRCLMYRNRGHMVNRAVFKMTPGRAALVGLMGCYLRCPCVSRNRT